MTPVVGEGGKSNVKMERVRLEEVGVHTPRVVRKQLAWKSKSVVLGGRICVGLSGCVAGIEIVQGGSPGRELEKAWALEFVAVWVDSGTGRGKPVQAMPHGAVCS